MKKRLKKNNFHFLSRETNLDNSPVWNGFEVLKHTQRDRDKDIVWLGFEALEHKPHQTNSCSSLDQINFPFFCQVQSYFWFCLKDSMQSLCNAKLVHTSDKTKQHPVNLCLINKISFILFNTLFLAN